MPHMIAAGTWLAIGRGFTLDFAAGLLAYRTNPLLAVMWSMRRRLGGLGARLAAA